MGTMIRAAVALVVSDSLLGCFPHNARRRTYAQIGEGTAIVAGIAISAFSNTAADCDQMAGPGIDDSGCKSSARWASTAGVTLILAGLLGFVATVSTAEDAQQQQPKPIEIKAEPAPAPAAQPSPTVIATPPATSGADTSAAGSAATPPPAPQP